MVGWHKPSIGKIRMGVTRPSCAYVSENRRQGLSVLHCHTWESRGGVRTEQGQSPQQ
jgi:hypothetical protein